MKSVEIEEMDISMVLENLENHLSKDRKDFENINKINFIEDKEKTSFHTVLNYFAKFLNNFDEKGFEYNYKHSQEKLEEDEVEIFHNELVFNSISNLIIAFLNYVLTNNKENKNGECIGLDQNHTELLHNFLLKEKIERKYGTCNETNLPEINFIKDLTKENVVNLCEEQFEIFKTPEFFEDGVVSFINTFFVKDVMLKLFCYNTLSNAEIKNLKILLKNLKEGILRSKKEKFFKEGIENNEEKTLNWLLCEKRFVFKEQVLDRFLSFFMRESEFSLNIEEELIKINKEVSKNDFYKRSLKGEITLSFYKNNFFQKGVENKELFLFLIDLFSLGCHLFLLKSKKEFDGYAELKCLNEYLKNGFFIFDKELLNQPQSYFKDEIEGKEKII